MIVPVVDLRVTSPVPGSILSALTDITSLSEVADVLSILSVAESPVPDCLSVRSPILRELPLPETFRDEVAPLPS